MVIVLLVTTLLMIPIMFLVWRSHWIFIVFFAALFLSVELTYFSAVLFKVNDGGWVPLVIAAAFFFIMYVWHYGTVKRYEFEMHSRVSIAWILGLGPSLGLVRVPGIGFVYTDLASGVPHIFSHLITNLPAIHSVVVFVCVKYLPVYTVPVDERFLVKRIGTKSFHIFRCVARYGYKDVLRRDDDFEKMLLDSLSAFVRLEAMMERYSDSDEGAVSAQQNAGSIDLLDDDGDYLDTLGSIMEMKNGSSQGTVPGRSSRRGSSVTRSSAAPSSRMKSEEVDFLNRCKEAGVVHILSNTMVRARRDSNLVKKIGVDYVYAFLRRICRENSVMFNLPHESLLSVGQIFYV